MAKPAFKRKKDKEGVSLHIEGDIHAQYARELKKELLAFLNRPSDLQLNLDAVTTLDVTALQLIYILRKAMKDRGHEVKISLPQDEGVRGLLEKSGFTKIFIDHV